MIALRTGDLVLLADGEKAFLLENSGDTAEVRLTLRSQTRQANPPAREQASDRPGRRADHGPGQRSAMAETDFHALAKLRFADQVAEDLNRQAASGERRRLVLAAAPQVLGEMRGRLSDEARAGVVAEIPKTLTGHPLDEVARILIRDLAA